VMANTQTAKNTINMQHAWKILAILLVGAFMALLDVTIVNVGLVAVAIALVFILPKNTGGNKEPRATT
jgi:Flp pilus assembly protein TadB